MSTSPPPQIITSDGAAQDTSDSDDHFSSASEGAPSQPSSGAAPSSPIPITRVERVDDKPHHGEVPGTSAYAKRTQDAVPDEIEIVPEGLRSRSGTLSRSRANSAVDISRPQTPGGTPIPRTVVERVDEKPSYGEVDGTLAKEKRMADASPDEMRVTPDVSTPSIQGRPNSLDKTPEERQAWFRSMWDTKAEDDLEDLPEDEPPQEAPANDHASNDPDEELGDDFDDFAEGGDNEDDFGDFGDFDDADVTPMAPEPQPAQQPFSPSALAGLPALDLNPNLSSSELHDTLTPYLDAIFPDSPALSTDLPSVDLSNASPFLSDRSLSLWQQLVSPPPMAPPNWTRSRIRRLFLVSLGVPVDLDEILPPSKQKRLILPNIDLGSSTTIASPRPSTGGGGGGTMDRLRHTDTNDSSTSLDSKTAATAGRRPRRTPTARGPPPPPDFDANAAALVCGTTAEAMARFADDQLREHVVALEGLNGRASLVLEYWLQRKDEGLKEKEALEGVIENLVGFVKGRRGK